MQTVQQILKGNKVIVFKVMSSKQTGSMKSTKSTAQQKNIPPNKNQKIITLDRTQGKKLGVIFKKNPETGSGILVKSVVPNEQVYYHMLPCLWPAIPVFEVVDAMQSVCRWATLTC